MQIADAAKLEGVFQITFTDLDLTSFVVPAGSILPLFAQTGMLDINFGEAGAGGVGFGARTAASVVTIELSTLREQA